MRLFFDVDHTLLNFSGETWVLRPGAKEVLSELGSVGFDVYLWSATGRDHCERFAQTFGLIDLIQGCFDKDSKNPIQPDLIVDDDEYLVQKYSGVWVTPYREPDPKDRELFRVLDELRNRPG